MADSEFPASAGRSRAAWTRYPALLALLCMAGTTIAQNDATQMQEQIDQMSEVMRNSGLTAEQLQGFESVMQGVMQQGVAQQEAESARERAEFEALTAGLGTATVAVDGEQYDLRVTKCEYVEGSGGGFTIQAQKGPDRKSGHLNVSGAGRVNNSYVNFRVDGRPYESDPTAFEFDGQTLEWQGTVLGQGTQRMPLTLALTCRQ